jgi:ABC-2 type transport system permease protein
MFRQIFLFELKYRLQRPAFYIYFLIFFAFAFIAFANGAIPVQEKEFYNAPAMLALYSSMISIFMMLPCSSIMGVPLYRDIEHNTKDYYLSYPITKPGYFWGRFFGSFLFVLLIGSAVYWGAWAGTLAGPAFGWSGAGHYGPFHFYHYLHPYLTILLPNVFFMSALFFGLVAVFRNVKVIYSSALFLFLGYIISNFFFRNTTNVTVIYLWDPFAFTPLRMTTGSLSPADLNGGVISMQGLLLGNRILWTSVGMLILLGTYWRFSFARFFGGSARRGKERVAETTIATGRGVAGWRRELSVRFTGSYSRKILYTLTRIEILNIVRDNYFWIIMSGGLGFLGFLFWNSFSPYGVPDNPRSAFFMSVYMENFQFFIFFILMFYTGETVHRERVTRYAFINDSLPPPNWVLGSAKVLSLLALAVFLSLVPMLLGLTVQTLKGYHQYHFPVYFTSLFVMILPNLIEMVLFCYVVQTIVSNKFAGYGIGIIGWVLIWAANTFGYFTYIPLLYGIMPYAFISDMDGAGHMLRPLLWFHSYWLLAGGCLLVVAALFFIRGTNNHFTERLGLLRERYRGNLRLSSLVLLAGYLAIGIYIYYNISVLNVYVTHAESDQRRVLAERELKHFETLPLPRVTRLRLQADLYPGEQREITRAFITIRNDGSTPIDTFLLDGDNLTEYTLKYNGDLLPYRCPLSYPRGKFNFFRPARDTADYRLYTLPAALLPGDTALVEINSLLAFRGFRNESYARNQLYNGTVYNGGLPGLGYDDDEEIRNNDKRKEYGLPVKVEQEIPHDDPEGVRHLGAGAVAGLTPIDITVSTSGDQWAVGPGRLQREWMEGGRHYFHYVQEGPGIYIPFIILSARYARMQDSIAIAGSKPVRVSLYYHPAHSANLDRMMTACKDGLRYMSTHYGHYPFGDLSLAEGSVFAPRTASAPGLIMFADQFGWNAHITDPKQTDYLYYRGTELLANQWWGQQVAPNNTTGSPVVSSGLSKYLAMVLMENKYGKDLFSDIRFHEMNDYIWSRIRDLRGERKENTLLYANDWNKWALKAGIVLYGLRDLVGEDSVNAALREFYQAFALRASPPYAGSEDLYKILRKHVPDSLQYYLTDTWEKVCLYDNKVVEVKAVAADSGANGGVGDGKGPYRLSMKVSVNKIYIDSSRQEHAATGMKDYIDIGVYGAGHKELYLKKIPFSEGEHVIELLVPGKPVSVGIDPGRKLIDRKPEDNRKDL